MQESTAVNPSVKSGEESIMRFDADTTRERLVTAIRDAVTATGFHKVVVGISGGKDSTVVATLCARAIGKENVIGVMMPDGAQTDVADSLMVIERLGIQGITVNIGPIHEALLGAVPFPLADSKSVCSPADTNVPPRLRMTVLRYVCQSVGALLAGTSNLSEIEVGYFTKDGDSSCDIAVLAGLTSVEVVEVGRTMPEIPCHLVEKPPADGLTGKTDEEALGVSYSDIHEWIRMGTSGNKETDTKIQKLHDMSEHKRHKAVPLVVAMGH